MTDRRAKLNARQREALALIEEAADKQRPCPTNSQFQQALGVGDNAIGTKLIAELEEAGIIFVERILNERIVTIVDTGAETRRPGGLPPRRDAMPPTLGRPALAPGEKRKPYATGIDRTDVVAARRAAPAKPRESFTVPMRREPTFVEPVAQPAPPPPAPQEQTMPDPSSALPVALPAGPALKADVEFADGELRLTVYLSTDPGPVREFRPFIIVPLDDMRALELVGTASIALRDARAAKEAA